MRRSRFLSFLLTMAALSGCGEPLLAPAPPEASQGLLSSLLRGAPVEVVRRTIPLATDEQASSVIGPAGGRIELPRAGLTIDVPAGALATSVRISVTAPAGNLVGYHFAPHGLRFQKPLIATQKTAGTELAQLGRLLSPPVAAYFEGDLEQTVRALEVLDLRLSTLLGSARFEIRHFSGYVIAMD